jgi:hypothetical protein
MSYGYSQRLVFANQKADVNSLGVALGRLCIERNIPVNTIAEYLNVSRATIYNWFWGVSSPSKQHSELIVSFVHKHKKRK